MADAKPPLAPIAGDISTASEVTVNRKGGSLTATLKKTLRERIDLLGNHMHAAALQFGSGQSVLLHGMRRHRRTPKHDLGRMTGDA
ncbi:MAG: hypothetical protein RIB84_15200 [Sneathiellaceae bacterium]